MLYFDSQILNGRDNGPHDVTMIRIKKQKRNDSIWRIVNIWLQNLLDPLKHYFFIHPCIVLTCVKNSVRKLWKLSCHNPSIWFSLEDHEGVQHLSRCRDCKCTCCLLRVTCRFAHMHGPPPDELQC